VSPVGTLTIHKFPVVPGRFKLSLPRGARILDVQMQHDEPQMWVLLDEDDFKTERQFFVMGTGHKIEGARYDDLRYCGTFQMQGGKLVWHVFEAKP